MISAGCFAAESPNPSRDHPAVRRSRDLGGADMEGQEAGAPTTDHLPQGGGGGGVGVWWQRGKGCGGLAPGGFASHGQRNIILWVDEIHFAP